MTRHFHTVLFNHGELLNLLLAAATNPAVATWTPAARGGLLRALHRLAEQLGPDDWQMLALVRRAESDAAGAEAREAVAAKGDRSES